ncbi:MAG: ABC transporter permease [Nitrospirota bacterium]
MKRIYLNLKIAVRSLLNFKLRTALAVLGVFLGTFSLIVVSNLSDSLLKKTQMEADKLGKSLLIVRSGIVRRFGASTRLLSEATTLTVGDAEAIMDGSALVRAVSPSGNKTFPVRYEDVVLKSVLVVGIVPNYSQVRNFGVRNGRFVGTEDNRDLRKVAVIGTKVARRLFGNRDPLGKHILIWRVPCEVIGIMEEKGVDVSGLDQDNQIFVPLNTFLRRLVNKDYVSSISVQTVDERSIPAAKTHIEEILRKRHRIKDQQDNDFTVIDLKDVMAVTTQATSMINVLGKVAAVISFIIGGIGILSIMILIVNERRLEIGIRRAVGSRKRDIILQFLLESSFISLSGGTAGLLLSAIASVLIFLIAKLPFAVSPGGLVLSFFASVVVGILAGLYPSQKATRIQPVDVIKS